MESAPERFTVVVPTRNRPRAALELARYLRLELGWRCPIVIVDQSGKELATHKVHYGARVHVKEGDTVKRGTKLAQWDPYTRPILTEVEGTIGFEDLVEGSSGEA